jgi:hypothetical protein
VPVPDTGLINHHWSQHRTRWFNQSSNNSRAWRVLPAQGALPEATIWQASSDRLISPGTLLAKRRGFKIKEIAMKRIMLAACALLFTQILPAAAEDSPCKGIENEGVWTGMGHSWPKASDGKCVRKFACGPKQTTMTDASCKLDGDIGVGAGKCDGDGPAPPSYTCHYKWVKK